MQYLINETLQKQDGYFGSTKRLDGIITYRAIARFNFRLDQSQQLTNFSGVKWLKENLQPAPWQITQLRWLSLNLISESNYA